MMFRFELSPLFMGSSLLINQLIRREEPINKGGCSNLNMQRCMYHSSTYMHQSTTDNSRTTATTTTGTGTTTTKGPNSRSTSPTSTVVNSKWVINMSKKQEKVLAHGPNYVVTPRSPLIGKYITTIKKTCQNLNHREADEMRAEIKAAIQRSHPSRHKISREEQKTLTELKKDDTRVILSTDKVVCLVVMDKEEYIGKVEELLKEKTYKIIPKALPTGKSAS